MAKADADRERRLAEALRANLRRRKEQARATVAGPAEQPEPPEPPAAFSAGDAPSPSPR